MTTASPQGRWGDSWAQAGLAYLLVALPLVLPGLLPGRVLAPLDVVRDLGAWKPDPAARIRVSNSLLSDPILQTRPWEIESRRALSAGRFPWRNGYSGEGVMLFNNPAAALLSPFTWVRLALENEGWALSVLMKMLVGALGMRCFVLVLKGSRRAALFSGLVYMLSGYSILWSLHPQTNVSALLPWLAAAGSAVLLEPSPGHVVALIAASALATAGGHPETLAFGVLGIAVFLGLEVRQLSPSGAIRRSAALAACAAGSGFLLVGVQLVPFLRALGGSRVASLRSAWGVDGLQLFTLAGQVLPGFLGSPLRAELDLSGAFPGSGNIHSRSEGYVGLLVLAAIGLTARRLAPAFRRCLAIAGLGLVISLSVPPIGWLWSHLPLTWLFAKSYAAVVVVLFAATASGPALEALDFRGRTSRRVGVVLLSAGAVLGVAGAIPSIRAARPAVRSLAAEGLVALQQRGYLKQPPDVYERRLGHYVDAGRVTALRRLVVPALLWMMGGAVLVWIRSHRILMVLAILELVAFAWGYLPSVSTSDLPGPPPALRAIRALSPGPSEMLAVSGDVFPPDLATVDGVRDVRAYEYLESSAWASGLRECGYDEVVRAFPENLSPVQVDCLGRLGVRYLLSREAPPTTSRIGGGAPPAVGAYRIPAARAAPSPLEGPPPGIAAGIGMSLAGLLLGAAAAAIAAKEGRCVVA